LKPKYLIVAGAGAHRAYPCYGMTPTCTRSRLLVHGALAHAAMCRPALIFDDHGAIYDGIEPSRPPRLCLETPRATRGKFDGVSIVSNVLTHRRSSTEPACREGDPGEPNRNRDTLQQITKTLQGQMAVACKGRMPRLPGSARRSGAGVILAYMDRSGSDADPLSACARRLRAQRQARRYCYMGHLKSKRH